MGVCLCVAVRDLVVSCARTGSSRWCTHSIGTGVLMGSAAVRERVVAVHERMDDTNAHPHMNVTVRERGPTVHTRMIPECDT